MMQYAVVWKRVGQKPKRKIFRSRCYAERRMRLLGPEPWTALEGKHKDPDSMYCCSGRECGCAGMTTREAMLGAREQMPKIEYLRLETRTVIYGAWMPI